MTRLDFQESESKMANLAELLRQPEMAEALDIARAEAVKPLPNPIPNVSYVEMIGVHGAQAVGWAEGIKALVSLSRKPAAVKQPDQSRMYSDAAKRRLIESGQYTEEELRDL